VRLSDGTSIHSAKLYAIGMAVGRIADAPLDSGPFFNFTDSLSAAWALSSDSSGSGSDIVFRLRQEINIIISNKIHLTIAWLPGHSGVPGNHAVDLLAKLALSHTTVEVVIKPTVPEYFARINHYIDAKWQTIYNSSSHGLHYKMVQPSISRTCKFTYDRVRGLERITTRLRFGKCLLNNYLYKLKLHPSGLCDVCGSAKQ